LIWLLVISLLLLPSTILVKPGICTEPLPGGAALVAKHEAATVADRRWFHANPELSGREFRTQAKLRQILTDIPGVEFVPGEWGTGLVAMLRGAKPGPLVAWRADIDALPITEATGLPYASTCTDTLAGRQVGVMHACGHDIHMSVALGALRVLAEVRDQMPGTLLFILQPAEETGDGAKQMLAAGVFDDGRRPKCVLALHDHPTLKAGQIGSCPGWATANVDGFRVVVRGNGGHGAYPHQSLDPVTLAAQMVEAFNRIVAREIDVNNHCVISVGSIHGGAKGNVIPDEVVMDATVRTHDEATRLAVKAKIERTVYGLAAAMGAPEPELEYSLGTPAGYNDPELVAQARAVIRRVVGVENDIEYPPGLGGEDFARFSQVVPGFQFRLGVDPPAGTASLHSPEFAPDERVVAIGMRVVAEIIWDQLQRR
jgi:amidohydrolase